MCKAIKPRISILDIQIHLIQDENLQTSILYRRFIQDTGGLVIMVSIRVLILLLKEQFNFQGKSVLAHITINCHRFRKQFQI